MIDAEEAAAGGSEAMKTAAQKRKEKKERQKQKEDKKPVPAEAPAAAVVADSTLVEVTAAEAAAPTQALAGGIGR